MSNKTPFEVRLELIAIAKDMLERDYNSELEIVTYKWYQECEAARSNNQSVPDMPDLPSFPSSKQILEKASELNEFVSKG
jgi:hypothetical protein